MSKSTKSNMSSASDSETFSDSDDEKIQDNRLHKEPPITHGKYHKAVKLFRRLFAELVGTFILVFFHAGNGVIESKGQITQEGIFFHCCFDGHSTSALNPSLRKGTR